MQRQRPDHVRRAFMILRRGAEAEAVSLTMFSRSYPGLPV